MEKQQKMRSAAAFRDQIYVAEHFFQVRFKGQKKVDRLNLLILPTLKAPFRGFLFLQEAPICFWVVVCKTEMYRIFIVFSHVRKALMQQCLVIPGVLLSSIWFRSKMCYHLGVINTSINKVFSVYEFHTQTKIHLSQGQLWHHSDKNGNPSSFPHLG